MIKTHGFAVQSATSVPAPFDYEQREPGPKDVHISIDFCGVCHSDIHQAHNDWGNGNYPMVPGHEIIGTVKRVGAEVTKFKIGDLAGVGCMVDSCRVCASCKEGEEQYCDNHATVLTYNSKGKDGKFTLGGYGENIVVDEAFVLIVPRNLNPAAVAPLLCAGITTYSPLKHWKVGPGKTIGVIGLGGLGHMALKISIQDRGCQTPRSGRSDPHERSKLAYAAHEQIRLHSRLRFCRTRYYSLYVASEKKRNSLHRRPSSFSYCD
jgi:uncharacterized zinc-type alcohol dehydrogenase-like protein